MHNTLCIIRDWERRGGPLLLELGYDLETMLDESHPKYTAACMRYGGCQYLDVCHGNIGFPLIHNEEQFTFKDPTTNT
jgi:hypothetical protein